MTHSAPAGRFTVRPYTRYTGRHRRPPPPPPRRLRATEDERAAEQEGFTTTLLEPWRDTRERAG